MRSHSLRIMKLGHLEWKDVRNSCSAPVCTCGSGPAPGSLPMGQVVSLMDLLLHFSVPLPEDVENCLFSSYEK